MVSNQLKRSRRRRGARRFWRQFSYLVFISIVVATVVVLQRHNTDDFSGIPRVIDGDTLVIADRTFRLYGIDAPELMQSCGNAEGRWPCGRWARAALHSIAGDKLTQCQSSDSDRYGRLVGRCFAGQTDIAAEIVEQGYAVATDDYHREEGEARRHGRGIWSGPFETPRVWRDARKGEDEGRTILDRVKDLIGGN